MPADTLDLFRRAPRPHDKTPETPEVVDEPPAEATEHPACVDRPGSSLDHPFMDMTVDQWMDAKDAPHTVELDSPRGKLYLTKNRAEQKRLVAAGAVVFSPLEIEQFIKLKKKCLLARADRLERGMEEGPEAINESLIDRIYAIKRIDPGSKLDVMELEPADDVPWVYREEEMENEQR